MIFTSDNGTTHRSGNDPVLGVGGVDQDFFASTRELRGFKGSVFEGGLRVPMIARWPGRIPAGAVTDSPTYFPDLFPTLCDLLDTRPPVDVDGITILPTMVARGLQPDRNPMVWAFAGYGGQVAVRLDDWKVIRSGLNRKNGPPDAWMVFDIAKDPNETTDLAADHPEVIERARGVLRQEIDDNPIFPLVLPSP